MSTGLECAIVEVRPGEWYYVLERGDAPKLAFSWMEHADAYGPFPTLDAAEAHLSDNHANPGGWWEQPYEEGSEPGELMQALIKHAPANVRAMERPRMSPWGVYGNPRIRRY